MYSRFWAFPVLVTTLWCATPLTATAQIVPDNTLGSENSVVTPNLNIRNLPSDRIDGGAVRGGNLFHSFQEFNVDVGRGAYFSNPDSIVNILTRVTGDNISNILGTLGVLGNANLFLINPNGIVFGPHARLDVGGSFFASTADGILFENGVEFAASNPEAPPLLTINIPLGLNIRENPGTIVNQATLTTLEDGSPLRDDAGFLIPQGLNVPQNKTLALIGGNVLFDNGVAISPGSNIELGGLSEPGIVELNADGSLIFPENTQKANVTLTNQSQINVRSNEGRDININAQNFEMSGGSIIRAGIDEGLGFPEAQAGDVNINTQESVVLREGSFISSIIDIESQGNPGNINIETGSLLMENGTAVSASTFGPGNAGSVSILATDSVALSNSLIFSNVEEGAVGNGGGIEIITGNLFMSDASQVGSFTSGQGDGGLVSVQATNSVELSGQDTALFGGSNPTAIGQGGNVTVNTGSLILRDNAIIETSTFGQGNAGSVSIFATDSVELFSGNITTSVAENAVGNGNTVTIETRNLLLSGGSEIQSLIFGTGNAGNITVKAESVELTGTSADGLENVLSASSISGEGNAGTIVVEAERLRITDGGGIVANTTGRGNAGTIFIQATDVEIQGFNPNLTDSFSLLSASFLDEGTGNSGNIIIETARLLLEDGGLIRVNTTANTPGNPGQVLIIASESVRLNNAVGIDTDTLGSREAASITIFTQSLFVEEGSIISARSGLPGTTGQGGEISIFASEQVQLSGEIESDETPLISAVALGDGNAGNIRIETPQLVIDNGLITVASNEDGSGDAGNIQVFASNFIELSSQGELLAATRGEGNAGNITVETPQLVLRDEASIGVGSFSGRGNAGNITVKTPQLVLRDEAFLLAETNGDGDAGDITINTSELVEVRDQGRISARTEGNGNAGNVRIETEQFQVRDGGSVDVRSTASGRPGNIEVSANETLLNNQAELNARSEAGQGGNIRVQSNDVRLLNESGIVATGSESNQTFDGNIEIDANLLVLLRRSEIITNASSPSGGSNITIRPLDSELAVLQSQNSTIRAAGELEIDDTLNFDPPESLEITVVDPNDLIAQEFCRQRGTSQFTITGRGGLASSPNDIFTGDRTQVSLVEPVPSRQNPSTSTPRPRTEPSQPLSSAAPRLPSTSLRTSRSGLNIIPARGWIRDENGDVILVSYDPTKTGVRRQQYNPHSCQP